MKNFKKVCYFALAILVCVAFMPVQGFATLTGAEEAADEIISEPSPAPPDAVQDAGEGDAEPDGAPTGEAPLATQVPSPLPTDAEKAPGPSSPQPSATPEEPQASADPAEPSGEPVPDFTPLGPPLQKTMARSISLYSVPSSPQFSIGGQPGDYLYLIYDRGDSGVRYKNMATLEVFKDDKAGTGSWQTQYYDNNSSGVSIYYSINGVPRHYVTPYYTTWAASAGTQLKDSDAVVTKPDNNTISVKWINSEFTFEMRYIYRSGSLSFQREYYLTNTSGAQMTNVKLVYGGDTYFGGNDYGYSYWDPNLNMVYVRSSDSASNFMGLSSGSAGAYFGGAYNLGAVFADQATLPNSVTTANTDQSYYLQWNKQYINASETFSPSATESYSIGGALQVISPQNQGLASPTADTKIKYSFLAVNTDGVSAQYDFTAVSSRGYSVDITPSSASIAANAQKQVDVTVTIPAGAAVGDDKITFTGTNNSTGVKSVAYAITTITTPPDVTPPVIGNISYTKNTTWVSGSETVGFTVTDNVAVDNTWVRVQDPSGSSVSVTKGTGNAYSFVAAASGIYTINAKDTSGNAALPAYTKQINVDNTPPVVGGIRIAPKGTINYTSILNTASYGYFTNVSSEITVTANDAGSGVSSLRYQFVARNGSINESAWVSMDYSANPLQTRDVVFSALPNYAASPVTPFVGNVAVRLTDAAGNTTTTTLTQNGKYVSENTAPNAGITAITTGFDPAKWYTSVAFRAVASDPDSGLQKVELLNNDTVNYTNTPTSQASGQGASSSVFNYTATAPGIYSVRARATDKSGNTGMSVGQEVRICNQTPVLVLTPEPPTGWTNTNVVLNLSNSNTQVYSPVTYYYQRQGDSAWQTIGTAEPGASTTFTLNANTNATYIFKAITATGKESVALSRTIQIDKTAPSAAVVHTQAQTAGFAQDTPDGDNGWYKTIPSISITPPAPVADTNESPVKTMYRFAAEPNFASASAIEYNGTNPVITVSGKYVLEVFTRDAAGNESAHQTRYIDVDTVVPVIGEITMRAMNLGDVTGVWDLFALFGGNVIVSAPVSDNASGLFGVYYQLVADGATFDPAGSFTRCATGTDGTYQLTVSPQFKGTVYLAVKDNAGNGTYKVSGKLIADSEPPTTPSIDAGGYTQGTWTAAPVKIQAGGSSALSGIAGYYYRVKGEPDLIEMPPGGLNANINAETTYQIYAKSNLGMLSAPTEFVVRCDTLTPQITAMERQTDPTNQDVDIDMTASAGLSGIKRITVSLNGGTAIDITPRFINGSGTMKLSASGRYTFTIENGMGITSSTTCSITNIDKQAPDQPAYSVAPDTKNPAGNEPWRTEAQTITVTPVTADGGSAVVTYYALYATGQPAPAGTAYTVPITVDTDGVYTFEVWAQDAAGNQSGRQTRQISIDKTPPNVTMTLDGTSPFTNSADVLFTTNDDLSGVWYVVYTVKNADGSVKDSGYRGMTGGSVRINVAAPFEGTVEARIYDHAGNSAGETSETFVVTQGITVTRASAAEKTSGLPYYGRWLNDEVTFVLDVAGPLPEDTTVTGYEFSTDGNTWVNTGVVFDPVAQTAAFTTSAEGENTYYFRALTEYHNPSTGTDTPIEGIPTPAFTTRIDTTAPNVPTATIAQSEYASGVYNGYITVTLAGSDTVSAIRTLQYSLNGGTTWQNYSGAFNINPQFAGGVMMRAEDMAGNTNDGTTGSFVIDRAEPAPPTLSAMAGSDAYGGNAWTREDVVISVSGGEPSPPPTGFSGIAKYEYSTDGGASWQTTGAGNTITINTDGKTNVRVRAVSKAGIAGGFAVFSVWRDSVTPDITVSAAANEMPYDGTTWTAGDVTFTLDTTNTYASSYHYEYQKTGDSGWTKLPGNTLTISESGNVGYVFRIVSETGSTDSPVYTVKIDKIKPGKASATVSGTLGQNGWYTALTGITIPQVTLDVDDIQRSDITAMYSLYQPGAEPPAYAPGTPSITTDGIYILDVRTTDEAGNANDAGAQTIRLDGTVPTMDPIAFEPSGLAGMLFPGSVKVLLSGSDATSGILRYEYQAVRAGDSFDNANWSPYGLLYVQPSFKGTIYARAVDRAGNVSTLQSVSIKVDIEVPGAPALSGKQKTSLQSYTERTWESEVVEINIAPTTTPISGIDHYQVYDGTNWNDLAAGDLTFDADQNGKIVYQVRAVSGTGIIGPASTFEVWRDTQTPDLAIAAQTADGAPYTGNWTNQNVSVHLSNTTANPSGILFFEAFGGTERQVTDAVEFFADTAQGGDLHTFVAKNGTSPQIASAGQVFNVKIDKTAPEMPMIEIGTPDGSNGWYTAGAAITVTQAPQDAGSPVTTQISTDGGVTWNVYASDPAFPAGDGAYRYAVRAVDEAGNVSGQDGIAFGKDSTPPTALTFSFTKADGTQIIAGNGGAIETNQALYAKISGTDGLSGMNSITYTLHEDGMADSIIGPLVADATGSVVFELPVGFRGTVSAHGTDNAGNVNANDIGTSPRVVIDNKSAATAKIVPEQQPANKTWYRGTVKLDLRAQDTQAGLSRVVIKLNNVIEQDHSYPALPTDAQDYQLEIPGTQAENIVEMIAYDRYGNETVTQQIVNIDNTTPAPPNIQEMLRDANYVPPVITYPGMPTPTPDKNGFVGGQKNYDGAWVNMPVYFELGGDDTIPSGFAYFEYSVSNDGGASWSDWSEIADNAAKTHQTDFDQQAEYRFRVVSNVGAVSPASAPVKAKIDTKTPPMARIDIAGQIGAGGRYTSTPVVTVSAPSEEEGIHSPVTTYAELIDASGGMGVQQAQMLHAGEQTNLTVPEGDYRLRVYTKDEAGNVSAIQEPDIQVHIGNDGETTGQRPSPRTGDDDPMDIWVLIGLVSAGVAGAAAIWRVQQKKRAH